MAPCKDISESDASMRERLVNSLSASFPGSALSRALQCMQPDSEDEEFHDPDPLSSSCFAELRLDKGPIDDDDLTSLTWLQDTDLLKNINAGEHDDEEFSDDGQKENSDVKEGNHYSQSHPPHVPYNPQKHINSKPPYSFSCLIFMAIEDSVEKKLPVKDIYSWILSHFPYFQHAPTGWKNSVRHNLSLNKCFKKVDKDRGQSIGKGSLWCIDPDYRPNLLQALRKTPYHPYHQLQMLANPQPSQYPYVQKNLSLEKSLNKVVIKWYCAACDKTRSQCRHLDVQAACSDEVGLEQDITSIISKQKTGCQRPLPLTPRLGPNSVSPHLFPFLSKRLAQSNSCDVDSDIQDVAQTLVSLKGLSSSGNSSKSSDGEYSSPEQQRQRLKRKLRQLNPNFMKKRNLGNIVCTLIPSEDHTYSITTLSNPASPASSIDEEYDFGEDEDYDSYCSYESDDWDSGDEVDGPLPAAVQNAHTRTRTAEEMAEEHKKIVEGADALLNLAGIRTTSSPPDNIQKEAESSRREK